MSKKVLIADNDKMLLELLKQKLEKYGYTVIVSSDGNDALKKVTSEQPDVVVCELVLPSVTGSEIIQYIKTKIKKNTSVIAISSEGNESTILKAFELGIEDFVSKPFSANELLIRINKALNHTDAENKQG